MGSLRCWRLHSYARPRRRTFADGVDWVNAGTETKPLWILSELGELLGGTPSEFRYTAAATTRVRDLLAGKSALVIVDNLWSVEQLDPLLPTLDANTRLLVTARDAGLANGREMALGVLSEDAAMRHLAD